MPYGRSVKPFPGILVGISSAPYGTLLSLPALVCSGGEFSCAPTASAPPPNIVSCQFRSHLESFPGNPKRIKPLGKARHLVPILRPSPIAPTTLFDRRAAVTPPAPLHHTRSDRRPASRAMLTTRRPRRSDEVQEATVAVTRRPRPSLELSASLESQPARHDT